MRAQKFLPAFIPDSSVAINGKREAHTLRSKVHGFVPLMSRHRSAVLRADVALLRNHLLEHKMTLKLQSRTPSLLQDGTSPSPFFGLTAESGFIVALVLLLGFFSHRLGASHPA